MGKNGEVYSTRNPKSKWDWYELGGRWTGFLKLKEGERGETGKQGLMTSPAKQGYADSALLGDIDIDGMVAEAMEDATKRWRKAHALINGEPYKKWDEVKELYPIVSEARDFYNSQPPVKRFNESREFGFFSSPEDFDISLSDYATKAGNSAISTFAVIKNGEWYEKGEMGWWGMVHNESDQDQWDAKIAELIKGLPDDTLISIYDCHI
jgi:hypothetical protein